MNDLAFQYMSLSNAAGFLVNYVIIVVGGVVGGVATKDHKEMDRVPYFIYWMLIALLATLAGLGVEFLTFPAYGGGWLWVVPSISICVTLAIGFFTGRYAVRRSRSAFGAGKFAFLAFIPLVNFILFFWPPKDRNSPNRLPFVRVMTGYVGVAFGFALLLSIVFVSIVGERIVTSVEARSAGIGDFQESSTSQLIKTYGLEMALRMMTRDIDTPIAIDETTNLTAIEVVGTQLRRIYTVDWPDEVPIPDMAPFIVSSICDARPLIPILTEGGSVREVYRFPDDSELGAATVTREDCGL